MKYLRFILFFNLTLINHLLSQVSYFYIENFNKANPHCSLTYYSWTEDSLGAQGSNANEWYVHYPVESLIDSCYDLSSDVRFGALYIGYGYGCDSAELGAIYKKGCNNTTAKIAASPVISCSNKTNIILEFNVMSRGHFSPDYGSALYSSDGGNTWDTIAPHIYTGYCPTTVYSGYWQHRIIHLPSSANNNPNVKIGFLWRNNDDCLGSACSFAIDDVTLSSCDGIASFQQEFSSCTDSILLLKPLDHFNPSYNYTWIFDTTVLQGYETTYTPTIPGEHTLSLIVVSSLGCSDTLTHTVITGQSFSLTLSSPQDTFCLHDLIDITSNMIPNSFPPEVSFTYTWQISNNNDINYLPNYHAYLEEFDPAERNVSLRVIELWYGTSAGCEAKASVPLIEELCNHAYASAITGLPYQICQNGCLTLGSDAINATDYNWIIADGTPNNSHLQNPTICFPTVGNVTVELILTDSQMATDTLSNSIIVVEVPSGSYITSGTYDPVSNSAPLSVAGTFTPTQFYFKWYEETTTPGIWTEIISATSSTYTASPGNYKVKIYNISDYDCFEEVFYNLVAP